jgi:soluble lytic murein transglycosylase
MRLFERKRMAVVVLLIGLITASAGDAQQNSGQMTLLQKRQCLSEGVSLFQDKKYDQAVQKFEQLAGQYPELDEYVQFFLANTYINLGKQQDALKVFQQLLSHYPAHPLTDEICLNTANLLLANAKYQEAITLYTRLRDRPNIDQADIQYQFGKAYLGIGNMQNAVAAFQKVIVLYPAYAGVKEAKQALQKILAKDPKLTPQWTEETLVQSANALLKARFFKEAIAQYEAFKTKYPASSHLEECEFGIVDAYFQSGDSKKGMSTLEQLVTQYGATQKEFAARAIYLISSKHWGADRNEQAQQYLQRVVKDYAQTAWGDNAFYVLGRIAQSAKAYKDAAERYHTLATTYPASDLAEEALWRAGWSYYLSQQYDQAAQVFAEVTQAFPNGSYADESLYWQGRTSEKLKTPQVAINIYRQLLQMFPDTYYGILARKRLRAFNVSAGTDQQHIGNSPEFSAIVQELRPTLPSAMYDAITLHIPKVLELHEVRLKNYAEKEIQWIALLPQDTPTGSSHQQILFTYFLSRLYAAIEDYLRVIQTVTTLETLLKQSGRQAFPYPFETLKYPLAYWELIKKYAVQNSLDPFLVAAVIRQESAYDPEAISSANAQGLMQLVPLTGKKVAKQAGLRNFDPSQLYDPETNILLGTKYLASLLDQYTSDLYRSLAAYNAGPDATIKWWTDPGIEDQEVIVENITYRATQNYIKQVIRNQHYYRLIYSE